METGKCIIVSAPSGAGKTTLVRHLLNQNLNLAFSVSACSRDMRTGEVDGKDYYFLGVEGFKANIAEGKFIEFEEVYPNQFYGTLKAEIDRIWANGDHVIFDVDVVGGLNLKSIFGAKALSIFIQPPHPETLQERLMARGTESTEKIAMRVAKAAKELQAAPDFDAIVVNDELEQAKLEITTLVTNFLNA